MSRLSPMIPPGNLGVGEEEESSLLGIAISIGPI
jgi:hypothetical protein